MPDEATRTAARGPALALIIMTLVVAGLWHLAVEPTASHVGQVNLARAYGSTMAGEAARDQDDTRPRGITGGGMLPFLPNAPRDTNREQIHQTLFVNGLIVLWSRMMNGVALMLGFVALWGLGMLLLHDHAMRAAARLMVCCCFAAIAMGVLMQDAVKEQLAISLPIHLIMALCVSAGLGMTLACRPYVCAAILILAATIGTIQAMRLLSHPAHGGLPPLSTWSYILVALVQSAYAWFLLIAYAQGRCKNTRVA